MGLGQVLAVGALALDQIGDGVEPQPVDAHLQPVVQSAQDLLHHGRIVEIEVGLVAVEAVPEIGLRLGVPGPVRLLRVDEDDPRVLVLLVGVAPDVVVALGRARPGAARALEPGVLVGGVVDDQLGDHPQAAPVRLVDQPPGVLERAVGRVDGAVVGDVVAVVAQRRGVERQQPDRRDAQLLDVVELGDHALEIADAVAVGVEERLDVGLVDDRVLVPVRIGGPGGRSPRLLPPLLRLPVCAHGHPAGWDGDGAVPTASWSVKAASLASSGPIQPCRSASSRPAAARTAAAPALAQQRRRFLARSRLVCGRAFARSRGDASPGPTRGRHCRGGPLPALR